MKKAKRWTKAMKNATAERNRAKTPAAKAKAQKKINAAYKAAGLNMKGEVVKKAKKAVGGTVVKKKAIKKERTSKRKITNETAETLAQKNKRKRKEGNVAGTQKIHTKAKAYRETEEWARKNKLAPRRKK